MLAERTVTGTYRCAPESASSRSRYAPAGQSSVGTSTAGSQSVCTVLVEPVRPGAFCRWPRSEPDCQTCRAPSPWYQPSRKARTRNPGEVVDTNSGNDCPVSTLARPAYPLIASAAPRWRISQRGSPGSEFSATARRPVLARGVALTVAAGPELVLQPDAAASAPAAPRPRKARLLVPRGPLPSRVMADRMHPARLTRKQHPMSRR